MRLTMDKGCVRCGEKVQQMVFSSDGSYFCYPCYVAVLTKPIVMVELRGMEGLVNPYNRMKIESGMEKLYECGWRVKRVKEYVGSNENFPYKKMYTIRKLSGQKVCHLIRGFSWPRGMENCVAPCEV